MCDNIDAVRLTYILSSSSYVGLRFRKNFEVLLYREAVSETLSEARCESSCMLWDLKKFRTFPLYIVREIWKNSEFLLYRELVCQSLHMLWDLGNIPSSSLYVTYASRLEKIPRFSSIESPWAKHRTKRGASRHMLRDFGKFQASLR